MNNIIEVKNLKKYFGNIYAVDNITFDVVEGSLFAFLGLNGAGKSTTINILCSILEKDSGNVFIDNFNLDESINEIKNRIGIVFQNSLLDTQLTVEDNLKIKGSLYNLRGQALYNRIQEITQFLNLDNILKRPISKLSGGQKRKVDIARGIIHYPKILILDEPTTGLDPSTRRDVWNVLDLLRKNNKTTIFLTTHYMEEANRADTVVIMDNGKIVANDTPNNLKNIYSGDYIKLYTKQNREIDDVLLNKYDYEYENDCYKIKTKNIKQARDFIYNNQNIIDDFEVIKGDMDDVFLNVTGKKLNGDTL